MVQFFDEDLAAIRKINYLKIFCHIVKARLDFTWIFNFVLL